jgi:hypothetical protein
MTKNAKNCAFNDMLNDSARLRKQKSRLNLSNIQDALQDAELFRLIFGNDFVDDNKTIKQIVKEKYNV